MPIDKFGLGMFRTVGHDTQQISFAGLLHKSGGSMSGPLDLTGHKITNVGEPTVETDAVNKKYVDLEDTSGRHGPLNMNGNKVTNVGPATEPSDAVTLELLDTSLSSKVNKSGGTMSGSINMGGHKIYLLGDATDPKDAVNKETLMGTINLASTAIVTECKNFTTEKIHASVPPIPKGDERHSDEYMLTDSGWTSVTIPSLIMRSANGATVSSELCVSPKYHTEFGINLVPNGASQNKKLINFPEGCTIQNGHIIFTGMWVENNRNEYVDYNSTGFTRIWGKFFLEAKDDGLYFDNVIAGSTSMAWGRKCIIQYIEI